MQLMVACLPGDAKCNDIRFQLGQEFHIIFFLQDEEKVREAY